MKNNNLKINYEIKPSFTTRKIKELQQENKKYKEVIDDAIEYIENQIPIVKNEINIPNVNTATSELLNYGQLLEILKRW